MSDNLKVIQNNSNEEWDKLFLLSSNKSIYFHNDFLNSLENNHDKYLVYKNDELVAGFVALLDKDKKSITNSELVIYSGFYFAERKTSKINKQRVERMSVINNVLDIIGDKYKDISFTLSPDVQDMRPFHWYNYHNDLYKFKSEVKYTSFIDLSSSKEDLSNKLSSLRKRQIGYAENKKIEVKISKDFSNFISNYEINLNSQERNHPYSKNYFEILRNLLDKLSQKNLITLFELFRNDEQAYSVIFSDIGETTEYLYGTANKNNQESYDSTFLFWYVINQMKDQGKSMFNFEGVNSPDRGNFKLSFGGNLVPYYNIKKFH